MNFSKATTHAFPPANRFNPPLKPLLVCFSHFHVSFVRQRPQHLMTRAAHDYRVIFFEDPIFAPVPEPKLDLSHGPGAVTVAVPVLPEGLDAEAVNQARRSLLDELIEVMSAPVTVAWYYTPMALEISEHLSPRICVYDCMDELSAFLGAPLPLRRREH